MLLHLPVAPFTVLNSSYERIRQNPKVEFGTHDPPSLSKTFMVLGNHQGTEATGFKHRIFYVRNSKGQNRMTNHLYNIGEI